MSYIAQYCAILRHTKKWPISNRYRSDTPTPIRYRSDTPTFRRQMITRSHYCATWMTKRIKPKRTPNSGKIPLISISNYHTQNPIKKKPWSWEKQLSSTKINYPISFIYNRHDLIRSTKGHQGHVIKQTGQRPKNTLIWLVKKYFDLIGQKYFDLIGQNSKKYFALIGQNSKFKKYFALIGQKILRSDWSKFKPKWGDVWCPFWQTFSSQLICY